MILPKGVKHLALHVSSIIFQLTSYVFVCIKKLNRAQLIDPKLCRINLEDHDSKSNNKPINYLEVSG